MALSSFEKLAHKYEPYLEDARRRILLVTAFFLTVAITGFILAPRIIDRLLEIVAIDSVEYIATTPFQVLGMSIDVGLALAILATFPLFSVTLYEFVSPALTRRERLILLKYFLLSALLFLFGFVYGGASMYYAIQLVASLNTSLGLANLWAAAPFFSQILVTSALLGILFQFPLIIGALVRFEVVTPAVLRTQRRIVMLGIFILVALLPPTDGLSLLVMSAPLIGLYEATIRLV